MGLSAAKNIRGFESSHGWIHSREKMEEEGWSGDEEDSLPPLLHFRPVKITRPVHNSVVPCHFSILLCRWRTLPSFSIVKRGCVEKGGEKNCKKLQASPVDLREHARADRNATYRLFTVSLFVMDSNFAEDDERRRSTDRTISREVVDLTLNNALLNIGDILSKKLLE